LINPAVFRTHHDHLLELIPYPKRYTDKRGEGLWQRLMELLDEIEATRRAS